MVQPIAQTLLSAGRTVMSNPRQTECARSAIELMAAWLESPDGPPDRLVESLRSHIEEHPSKDRLIGAAELVMGMTYLCGSLLVMRELETGITAQETLLDLALEYAGD